MFRLHCCYRFSYISPAEKIQKIRNRERIRKEPILYLFTILFALGFSFSLTGCRHLTDIEEKSYVLSLYVDRLSGEENGYAFQVARADLNKMEERDEEIPCQITKIKAKTLKEFREKWNGTIFILFFSAWK